MVSAGHESDSFEDTATHYDLGRPHGFALWWPGCGGLVPRVSAGPPECFFVEVEIGMDDPRAEDVRALLAAHLSFTRGATPAEYSFALEVEQLVEPGVTFFSARRDEQLIGVAALKRLNAIHAELKSMHTREAERGRGVGRALVEHILGFARQAGYQRVSLETGSTAEFVPARRLYAQCGFRPCEPFGDYASSAYNAFMSISLVPAADPPST